MSTATAPALVVDIVAELKSAFADYQTAAQRRNTARRFIITHAGKNALLSLYFIQAESGLIKIGQSENPHARLKALQQGTAETLALLKIIPPSPTRLTERQIHQKFQHLRVRGEWFRPGPELIDFIGGAQ
jgi:hypothetical protein